MNNVRAPKSASELSPNASQGSSSQGSCGCNVPAVNYSQGYPKHPYHLPDRTNPALVAAGYQDNDVLDAQRVAALGRSDAHKRPYYHPSNFSCTIRPRAFRRQASLCASLRR